MRFHENEFGDCNYFCNTVADVHGDLIFLSLTLASQAGGDLLAYIRGVWDKTGFSRQCELLSIAPAEGGTASAYYPRSHSRMPVASEPYRVMYKLHRGSSKESV